MQVTHKMMRSSSSRLRVVKSSVLNSTVLSGIISANSKSKEITSQTSLFPRKNFRVFSSETATSTSSSSSSSETALENNLPNEEEIVALIQGGQAGVAVQLYFEKLGVYGCHPDVTENYKRFGALLLRELEGEVSTSSSSDSGEGSIKYLTSSPYSNADDRIINDFLLLLHVLSKKARFNISAFWVPFADIVCRVGTLQTPLQAQQGDDIVNDKPSSNRVMTLLQLVSYPELLEICECYALMGCRCESAFRELVQEALFRMKHDFPWANSEIDMRYMGQDGGEFAGNDDASGMNGSDNAFSPETTTTIASGMQTKDGSYFTELSELLTRTLEVCAKIELRNMAFLDMLSQHFLQADRRPFKVDQAIRITHAMSLLSFKYDRLFTHLQKRCWTTNERAIGEEHSGVSNLTRLLCGEDVLGKARDSFSATSNSGIQECSLAIAKEYQGHHSWSALTADQLCVILKAYGKVGFRHDTLCKNVVQDVIQDNIRKQVLKYSGKAAGNARRVNPDFTTQGLQADAIVDTSDTVKDVSKNENAHRVYNSSHIATICESMILTKRNVDQTPWWESKDEFSDLVVFLQRRLFDELPQMKAADVATSSWVFGKAKVDDKEVVKALWKRYVSEIVLKENLVPKSENEKGSSVTEDDEDENEEENDDENIANLKEKKIKEVPVHDKTINIDPNIDNAEAVKHLAKFLEGLVYQCPKHKRKSFLINEIALLAPWVCANIYSFHLKDLISINRWFADLGYSESSYYEVFVPFLTEYIGDMSKNDIQNIVDTYNKLRFTDEKLGGRHFFWALGKRYQELMLKSSGEEISINMEGGGFKESNFNKNIRKANQVNSFSENSTGPMIQSGINNSSDTNAITEIKLGVTWRHMREISGAERRPQIKRQG